MTTATTPTNRPSDDELKAKYSSYATRHAEPMSYTQWLYYYEEGLKGAAANPMTTKQRSNAGKAGAAKRWGKK